MKRELSVLVIILLYLGFLIIGSSGFLAMNGDTTRNSRAGPTEVSGLISVNTTWTAVNI